MELFAKVRSTRPPRPAVLFNGGGQTWIELAEGESGVAPGQACVLYSDDGAEARVFGGGFIARSERGAEAEAMLSRLAKRAGAYPGRVAVQTRIQSWMTVPAVRIFSTSIASSPLVSGSARVSMHSRKCSSSRVSGMPSSTGT